MSGLEAARVLVIGLGASGTAAAEALVRSEVAGLTVVDTRDTPEVAERAAALRARGLDARAGVTGTDVLADRDLVIASPGVAPSNPLLAAAIAGPPRVWSEPELAWRLNAGRTRLVAVTGTNGKTTTAELLAACLRSPVGGNIGMPLTTLLAAPRAPETVVAELSSFQLRFTEQLRCTVGVLLNVAADHLDWHGGLADYARAKARVWANQRSAGGHGRYGRDWAVIGVDDPGTGSGRGGRRHGGQPRGR
ncbi:MAG TPA: Mur ligase family protein [Egibacteraceae bacterium]|nr:Mur ligase family protein [Egibacteraceae bacterium]